MKLIKLSSTSILLALGVIGIAVPVLAAPVNFDVDVTIQGVTWSEIGDDTKFNIDDAGFDGGASDAYDDTFDMEVDSEDVETVDPGDMTEIPGLGVSISNGSQTISGVTVDVQFLFYDNIFTAPTVRALWTFTNPSGTDITVPVLVEGDFGSDDETTLEATSDGGGASSADTRWFVSSEDGGTGDPINTTVIQGPGEVVAPVSAFNLGDSDDDVYQVEFDALTVPAGATVRLLMFAQLHEEIAPAVSDAAIFDDAVMVQDTGALQDLTDDEIATIVNWQFIRPGIISGKVFADNNGDGLQDSMEPGVTGITLDLLDEMSMVSATTTTNADGEYTFSAQPGTYSIEATLPQLQGIGFTLQDQGSDDSIDSDVAMDTGGVGPFMVEEEDMFDFDIGLTSSGGPLADADGDGTPDDFDPCPELAVDDSNGDEVPDCDVSPETVEGLDLTIRAHRHTRRIRPRVSKTRARRRVNAAFDFFQENGAMLTLAEGVTLEEVLEEANDARRFALSAIRLFDSQPRRARRLRRRAIIAWRRILNRLLIISA